MKLHLVDGTVRQSTVGCMLAGMPVVSVEFDASLST